MPTGHGNEERGETGLTIQAAIESEAPKIYFNSFISAVSSTDIIVVLQRNQQPVAVLNASFTTIKSFAEKLVELISDFQKVANHQIMTSDDIAEIMERSSDAKSN